MQITMKRKMSANVTKNTLEDGHFERLKYVSAGRFEADLLENF